MHLKALYLHNFRLYKEALFEFSPGINVVRGPNARGKTSLLEAVSFLMTGRSFRTSQASDLIRQDTPHFSIDALFVKNGIEQKLRVFYSTGERRVIYNATACPSLSCLLGMLQGVVIHPDDTAIVKGAPAARRHLLDLQIAQSDPLYVHHLTRYERAMRQRNHLLKARTLATIDSWEYEMANSASYIIRQRSAVAKILAEKGSSHYTAISGGKEELDLCYKAHGTGDKPVDDAALIREMFRDQFKRHRGKEMEHGATLTGPHKDDFLITLGGKDARAFASEGQQRTCIVALRLAEWCRLKEATLETPLMLVDDIALSLDSSRKGHLLDYLGGLGQVFISTTDPEATIAGEKTLYL